MQIKIKHQVVTLSGNKISGNTYPVKDYIKSYLGGKWDAGAKSWTVDLAKVNDLIAKQCIRIDDTVTQAVPQKRNNGWCNRCHSYCYGDCTAND